MKIGEVPLSVVQEDPRMRLDAGHYLGVNEEREKDKAVAYVKRQGPATLRRLYRVYKAWYKARWRVFMWRVRGKIRI